MVRPPTCTKGLFDRPYRQFSLRLAEHIGAVVMFVQRTYTFTGTLEQCERAYRGAQTHSFLAGWRGVSRSRTLTFIHSLVTVIHLMYSKHCYSPRHLPRASL